MLRDPSLVPLSHQHHNALALCVLTRRALRHDPSMATIARLARRAIDRYELELANHFEIEEQILFPALIKHLGPLSLVDNLLIEHRQLEEFIRQLQSAPSAAILLQFCDLLSTHIRTEESNLFQMIQSRLPQPVLYELGSLIEAKAVRICL